MSEIKPNHICKNPNCKKGADGGRKIYYACNYCARTQNWKSVACSLECYREYMDAVIEARSKNVMIDTLPERTDMTKEEVKALMEKPVEVVLNETKEELKDYMSDGSDIFEAVEKINADISDKQSKKQTRKKKIATNE